MSYFKFYFILCSLSYKQNSFSIVITSLVQHERIGRALCVRSANDNNKINIHRYLNVYFLLVICLWLADEALSQTTAAEPAPSEDTSCIHHARLIIIYE